MANTKLILHGCSFFGFNNTCVDAWGQVSVRGCSFYACWIATAGRTKSQLSLKNAYSKDVTWAFLMKAKQGSATALLQILDVLF